MKKEVTPGAGQYKTEEVWPQGERKKPSYSIGARTKYTQKDTVPAPNRYSLPKLIGPNIAVSNKKYVIALNSSKSLKIYYIKIRD